MSQITSLTTQRYVVTSGFGGLEGAALVCRSVLRLLGWCVLGLPFPVVVCVCVFFSPNIPVQCKFGQRKALPHQHCDTTGGMALRSIRSRPVCSSCCEAGFLKLNSRSHGPSHAKRCSPCTARSQPLGRTDNLGGGPRWLAISVLWKITVVKVHLPHSRWKISDYTEVLSHFARKFMNVQGLMACNTWQETKARRTLAHSSCVERWSTSTG